MDEIMADISSHRNNGPASHSRRNNINPNAGSLNGLSDRVFNNICRTSHIAAKRYTEFKSVSKKAHDFNGKCCLARAIDNFNTKEWLCIRFLINQQYHPKH